jgi:hypothetical protein
MKKLILSLGVVLLAASAGFAQTKSKTKAAKAQTPTISTVAAPASAVQKAPAAALTGHEGHDHGPAATTTTPASNLKPEDVVFSSETHDFGTIPEGPAAEYEFTFTNKGKEPLIIQQVHASCGCTTPSYSKEPVLPGKTGKVKASYATAGRPNAFTKTITVVSNAGTKMLTIKGEVEKAPESSVPQNTSMIKTN